ncbi:MAG: universal stress protein, partial [Thaumarchaeota archaeon]|nr:universal stress protein [Nitrososphaerota archaeon]
MKSGQDFKTYERMLVGYDGSENAKRALSRAIALSTEQGSAIRIVVVVTTVLTVYGPTAPYYPPGFPEQIIKEGRRSLEEALSAAKEAGRGVSGSVEDGHPSEIILRLAESEGVQIRTYEIIYKLIEEIE